MVKSLMENIEVFTNTTTVSSATSVRSPWVDMSNAGGCLFMFVGSSLSGSSKITATIRGCTVSTGTTSVDHAYQVTPISSSTGYGADASMNRKLLAVDVINPPYRYAQMIVRGATGAAPMEKWIMIKHHLRNPGTTENWDSTSIGLGCSTVMGVVSTSTTPA